MGKSYGKPKPMPSKGGKGGKGGKKGSKRC